VGGHLGLPARQGILEAGQRLLEAPQPGQVLAAVAQRLRRQETAWPVSRGQQAVSLVDLDQSGLIVSHLVESLRNIDEGARDIWVVGAQDLPLEREGLSCELQPLLDSPAVHAFYRLVIEQPGSKPLVAVGQTVE